MPTNNILIIGNTTPGVLNSSPYGFRLGGFYWLTVEHYLLAQRFAGTAHADEIRTAATVAAARRLVRESDFVRLALGNGQ